MLVADHSALIVIITTLRDVMYNDARPEEYARIVISVATRMENRQANAAFTYLIETQPGKIAEYLENESPDVSEIARVKFSLERLHNLAVDEELNLNLEDQAFIKLLMEEPAEEPITSGSKVVVRPVADKSGLGLSAEGIKRPNFSTSSDVVKQPGQLSVGHSPSSTTVKAYSHAKLPEKPGAAPATRQDTKASAEFNPGKILGVVMIGFIVIALIGAFVAPTILEKSRAPETIAGINSRLQQIAAALDSYYKREGIYPRDLDILAGATPSVFTEGALPPEQMFREVYGKGSPRISYKRYVDGYILSARGPRGNDVVLDFPGTPTPEFDAAILQTQYDPTNGVISPGNLIKVSPRLLHGSGTP